MRSGRVLSFVAAALFANVVAAVPASSLARRRTPTAAAPAAVAATSTAARPDIPTIEVGNHRAVRQRDDGPRRAVRRRQQDRRRRLQRDLPDPGGLELHRFAERLHDGGRLRRRHPRRERGVRRRQHGGQRRLLGRLQDGRSRLRVPRARTQVRPRLRRRQKSSAARRATTATRSPDDGCSADLRQVEPGATCTDTARVSKARPVCGNGIRKERGLRLRRRA